MLLGLIVVLLVIFAVVLLGQQDRAASWPRTLASQALLRRATFFAMPLLLLPFALSVIFEAGTRHLPNALANILFFPGRLLLPLAYLHTQDADGLAPIIQSGTHLWDVMAWLSMSIVFGHFVRRLRFRHALALAAPTIVCVAAVAHFIASSAGLVFWGLPFRVVG